MRFLRVNSQMFKYVLLNRYRDSNAKLNTLAKEHKLTLDCWAGVCGGLGPPVFGKPLGKMDSGMDCISR